MINLFLPSSSTKSNFILPSEVLGIEFKTQSESALNTESETGETVASGDNVTDFSQDTYVYLSNSLLIYTG